MSVKSSVKKGFGVARQSLPVVGILSLFGFIWSLINLYYAPRVQQNPQTALSILIIIATIIFLFVSIFLQAGSLGYVRDKIKQGQADLSIFLSTGGKYYLPIFLVGLIITLVAVVLIVLAALCVAFLKVVGIVIAVIIAVIGVYLLLLVFFAPYIIVVKDEKAGAALKKSVSLVKKNLLAVLGISLILILIGFVIGILIGLLLGLTNVVVPSPASKIIYALVSSLLNSFLGVFVTASFMNFYMEVSNTSGA